MSLHVCVSMFMHNMCMRLHANSNPGSTHFRSQTEFQSGLHWGRSHLMLEFWLEPSCKQGLCPCVCVCVWMQCMCVQYIKYVCLYVCDVVQYAK